jgi:predicted metalloprotease with PDZ domain
VRYWLLHLLQIDSAYGIWLKGGLTTYYENMAVASKYSWDEIVERRFKPMYYYLNNIAGTPEIDQVNFTNHSFVAYFKSALTFFYINEIIKDRSEGMRNLDDAVKLLYKDALAGKCMSRDSLIKALNSLTDYDFASIVDKYLYGDRELDLDHWLK